MNKQQIEKLYKEICKQESLKPLPIKFVSVGKAGACLVFNNKTMSALEIQIDLRRCTDPEYALYHEIAHQVCLEKYKDPGHGAKFKKEFNRINDKYMYSALVGKIMSERFVIKEDISKKFDLKKDFEYLNKKYFDNKVNDVKILKFKNIGRVLGRCVLNHDDTIEIYISKFWDVDRRRYLSTLAHEMIHAYFYQNNIDEGHGNRFKSLMNDINRKSNNELQINVSTSVQQYNVSSTSVKNNRLFLCLLYNNVEYDKWSLLYQSINLKKIETIDSIFKDNVTIFEYIFKNVKFKSPVEIYLCISTNVQVLKGKKTNDLLAKSTNSSPFIIPEELAESLINNKYSKRVK